MNKPDLSAPCRFFSAEDACRLALQAYYAACRDAEPPKGEPFIVDGEPYFSASDFADAFCQEIADRLSALAYSQHLRHSGSKIDGPWWPDSGDELTEGGAVFMRRILKHLPPGHNALHNQPTSWIPNV